jgi:hypothetical protein
VRGRDFARQSQSERASKGGQQQFNQLLGDFLAWQKRSVEWTKNEGQNFGIVVLEQKEAPEDGGKVEERAPPETEKQ